jgi:hypothetical protein
MPDEILWPLRAVSKDPTNITKLDVDNNVLTSTTDLDARYVNVAGDTMTGPLAVTPSAALTAPAGHIQLSGEGFQPAISIHGRGNANGTGTPQVRFLRTRGTVAAPTSVQANDNLGVVSFYGWLPNGTTVNPASIVARCAATPAAGDTFAQGSISFSVNDGTADMVNPLSLSGAGCVATNISATGNVQAKNITATDVLQAKNVTAQLDVKGNNVTATATVQATQVTATSGATTVRLDVTGAAFIDGPIIQRATTGIAQIIEQTSPNATSQATGLSVNLMPEVSQFSVGLRVRNQGLGTAGNRGVEIVDLPVGPDNYAILNNSLAASYFRGNVGISVLNATHDLEVAGDTMLRGPLEVTGNITSAGTAHSFAAGSIGSPAVIGNTPRTIAATGSAGSAGQMVWDDDFIYLRTAGGWKKVALTAI